MSFATVRQVSRLRHLPYRIPDTGVGAGRGQLGSEFQAFGDPNLGCTGWSVRSVQD